MACLAIIPAGISMTVVWLVLAVVFAVVEAVTMGLTAIWFSAGALASMVAAMIKLSVPVQIAVFIVVSGIVLYFSRGLAQKYVNNKHVRTNADRVVGMEGVVIEAIDNQVAKGQIRVAGQVWTARGTDESSIDEGEKVLITAIEGVKAMVVRKEADAAKAGQEPVEERV